MVKFTSKDWLKLVKTSLNWLKLPRTIKLDTNTPHCEITLLHTFNIIQHGEINTIWCEYGRLPK